MMSSDRPTFGIAETGRNWAFWPFIAETTDPNRPELTFKIVEVKFEKLYFHIYMVKVQFKNCTATIL